MYVIYVFFINLIQDKVNYMKKISNLFVVNYCNKPPNRTTLLDTQQDCNSVFLTEIQCGLLRYLYTHKTLFKLQSKWKNLSTQCSFIPFKGCPRVTACLHCMYMCTYSSKNLHVRMYAQCTLYRH